MMAIAYAAQAPTGSKVFLKQYKSPAPTVVWYDAFVAYQGALWARAEWEGCSFRSASSDAFEETWGGLCYFQAYEFVEAGADLQQMLEEEREQYRRTKALPLAIPQCGHDTSPGQRCSWPGLRPCTRQRLSMPT